jgi:selenide, water dikinase
MYKLTQYSHGAGCGCKISPKVLDQILVHGTEKHHFPNLLVGNEERDDAAVMRWDEHGSAVISTTDFFMPIVDDAFEFGRIASVNAISDIYAMGGTPLLAIAILGWPINQLPAEVANQVIEGARDACFEAGIPLAGGHSIDSPEPIFGLAVTGRVEERHLKRNGGAKVGDRLFLTKPIGVGILTTAEKKGLLQPAHVGMAASSMRKLNRIGAQLGQLPYIHAMTDVTGFGLLGHLKEMVEASNASVVVQFDRVPLLDKQTLDYYVALKSIPGGTIRNWESYGHCIAGVDDYKRAFLADPQTSGGLLVAVDQAHVDDFQAFMRTEGFDLESFGFFTEQTDMAITVV